MKTVTAGRPNNARCIY